MSMKGKFIVIDGGEGSGKTTILKWFAETPFGKKFLITHEPGGTKFADKIRALALSEEATRAPAETQFGLMWAARAEHLKNKIIPALAKGVNVISDRFDSSTFAYQIYGQEAKHLEELFWQTREVFLRDRKPDIYIFLDVEPEIGIKRISQNRKKAKPLDHFEKRSLDFHQRVREGYVEFFKTVPHITIDAHRSLKEVQLEVSALVRKYIRS
ncbi:MAG TPA: dTMP kinase [Candidatus Taylorbacteria bacterium]|nr:dTMP kinase [Candidatus Taylorbacteria bacterium]